MLNQHSLEEIAELHNLLGDIKKEYEKGIKPILVKNSPNLFKNLHTVPKLKKIQINLTILHFFKIKIFIKFRCFLMHVSLYSFKKYEK